MKYVLTDIGNCIGRMLGVVAFLVIVLALFAAVFWFAAGERTVGALCVGIALAALVATAAWECLINWLGRNE
jgi:hypothetical protein